MICPTCQDDPCTCITEREKKKKQIVCECVECLGDGCTAIIRRPRGTPMPELCCFCQAKLQQHDVPLKAPEPERDGVELSRAEFTLPLYECIKTIGTLMQLRRYLHDTHSQAKTHQRMGWQQRERDLAEALPHQIAALSNDDAYTLMQRYPWVTE